MNIYKTWNQEKDEIKLIQDINYKIKSLYMNGQVEEVHEIFSSQWNKYIDLSYNNGSILEYAALIKDYKNKNKERVNEAQEQ